MAGSGVSESIMFSAALVLAITFVGVFAAIVSDAGQDLRQQGHRVSDGLSTDVVILNDPAAMATEPLVLYVRNTGQTTLSPSQTTVLVDGQAATSATYDVLESADDAVWPPGSILEITITAPAVAAGEHRVRVVTEHGTEDGLRFVV